ncbi:MAG: mechanosensitive ion channel family protein [Muribaculaceae bacterium]|nr:mechanosensitive ion channel family protein [Muribaculaceae bacterium]
MNSILLSLLSAPAVQTGAHIAEDAAKALPSAMFGTRTEENTYFLARWVMKIVEWLLNLIGMGGDETLFLWTYAIAVFAIAWGIGTVAQWIILLIVRVWKRHWKTQFFQYLTDAKFFSRTCRIVPPIVFLIFIQFTLNNHASIATWFTRITVIYLVFVVTRALSVLLSVIWRQVDERRNKRHLPLKGLVQLIQGVLWIIAIIITVAVLVNKSPGSLLAGLGAFAAVLMLVFKDSILGVVAGVQLAENDSLHVGDWIKVAGTDANGTVTEVSLTAVKIQNWDKTTTMVPPYTLVSGSFTNYRTMQQSMTRRIQRSYLIDSDSVVPTTDEMLAEYAKLPLLKEWIEKKIQQRDAGQTEDVNNPAGLVNGSIESNLGVFRAYLQLYLNASQHIAHDSDNFITTLPQTAQGIPLQVYAFTNTSSWFPYEAIQAAIFEHIAVMLYRFNLYVFESNTGRDTILEGYMCRSDNPATAFGLPYPFFNNQSSDPSDPGSAANAKANGFKAPSPDDPFSGKSAAPSPSGNKS